MSTTPSRSKTSRSNQRAAEAARAEQSRRRTTVLVVGAVVVIGIVAVVAIASGSKSPSADIGHPGGAAATAIVDQVLSVPQAVSDPVGVGDATPIAQALKPATGLAPLISNGKPDVLYIGAEYCPYCATERWAMAVALSRFGRFSGLTLTHSSSTDTLPNTPTLTFHGSTFTSRYLMFSPIEETNNVAPYQRLDTPDAAQQGLMNRLDPGQDGSGPPIPFVDIANRFAVTGVTYSPGVLQGQTWAAIAAALHQPRSSVGRAALGAANELTAAICQATHDQPTKVCTTPDMTALEAQLP